MSGYGETDDGLNGGEGNAATRFCNELELHLAARGGRSCILTGEDHGISATQ